MRILCTGSEGNIGSKLIPYLKSKGHVVYCIDQVQDFKQNYSVVNILSVGDLSIVFNKFKPEIVFHMAAMVSRVTCEDSPYLTVDTNLSGLNNVIQLCKTFRSKLIYFSTSEVYGNIGGYLSENRECKPNNLYGLTKYMGEKLVEYHLKDAIIVRPFMFFDEDETQGEHRSAMIRFCYHLFRNEKITVHKGSKRSWMHISDGVNILEKLVYTKGFHIVNIGSGELINTETLADIICQKLQINYKDYVIETPLPEKMTLEKIPDVYKQTKLTCYIPKIDLNTGIDLVLNKIRYDLPYNSDRV